MKIKIFITGICIIAVLLIVFLSFKACSGFVSSMDGDNRSKMMALSGGYYYNTIDLGLWFKDEKTDSYRPVIHGKVDSLSWNHTKIVGYSKYRYFVISILSGNLRHPWDIDSSLTGMDQKYQALDGVPSIKGLAIVH